MFSIISRSVKIILSDDIFVMSCFIKYWVHMKIDWWHHWFHLRRYIEIIEKTRYSPTCWIRRTKAAISSWYSTLSEHLSKCFKSRANYSPRSITLHVGQQLATHCMEQKMHRAFMMSTDRFLFGRIWMKRGCSFLIISNQQRLVTRSSDDFHAFHMSI